MAAMPADQLAQIESLMGAGGASGFGAIQEQLASLFASPDAMAQLQQTVGAMLAQNGGDPSALLAQMGLGGAGGADLLAQAQEQMEAMRTQNPELFAQLQAQMGLGDDADDADDADPGGRRDAAWRAQALAPAPRPWLRRARRRRSTAPIVASHPVPSGPRGLRASRRAGLGRHVRARGARPPGPDWTRTRTATR